MHTISDVNKPFGDTLYNKCLEQIMHSVDGRDLSNNSKATNSKVIMAKQYFETMSNGNLPKQQTFTKTPEPVLEV